MVMVFGRRLRNGVNCMVISLFLKFALRRCHKTGLKAPHSRRVIRVSLDSRMGEMYVGEGVTVDE